MFNRRSRSFQAALDEAEREPQASGDEATNGPRMRAPIDLVSELDGGAKARFDLAVDWMDEPVDGAGAQAPLVAASSKNLTIDEIAEQLGVGATISLEEVRQRWRDFVWRNHPDRQPADEREGANMRVAQANALYEEARRNLSQK